MKISSLILLEVFCMIILSTVISNGKATSTIELIPTENHHVTELNSNQPYVAGFHVNTPDLNTITRGVLATAVTVSFPSTDTSYFPESSWLGAGMFVQAQDSRYVHVDYGFYTTLVLDSTGNLFIDIGMHQTREGTAPLHTPTEQLVYAYTWQVSGINPITPVTLCAEWYAKDWIHYSVYGSDFNITLTSINIASLPYCENMIRYFYAGNVLNMPFPFGCYVQYFQFGVVSSERIADPHWSADLKNPMLMTETGWNLVNNAWSIQGDISYLDGSWVWGGMPYPGVSAQYYQNTLENPYEIIFFYNGKTLPSGTILWQFENPDASITCANSQPFSQSTSEVFSNCVLCFSTCTLMGLECIRAHRKKERCVRLNHSR